MKKASKYGSKITSGNRAGHSSCINKVKQKVVDVMLTHHCGNHDIFTTI